MNDNPKSDSYYVELIQHLPVLLEFGEYKLYDIDQFVGYYPELEDEYYHKLEDWNETYYYAIDNLQPDPLNQEFERYISCDIRYMVENNITTYFSENFDESDRELLFKEFYEKFRNIYQGIIAFFDELNDRLIEYGASEISPLLLNLYHNEYSIDVSTLKLLDENIKSGKYIQFSQSTTIKYSEKIKDSFIPVIENQFRDLDYHILVGEKDIFGDDERKVKIYDFLYREFQRNIDPEDQPDYNLKIMANLFPLLYYQVIGQETVAEMLLHFKPTTARLINNLSKVNIETQFDFLQKNRLEGEYDFVIAFLHAEFNRQILLRGNPELVIVHYLAQFIDPNVDDELIDDILKPIYNRQKK